MPNFNKVILLGHLTRDPELRHSQGGTSICRFGLAANSNFTGKDGEKKESVLFIDCTTFGKQGEYLAEAKKGEPVFVEGRLELQQWDDKATGEKRSKIAVIAERVQKLGGRQSEKQQPKASTRTMPDEGEIPF